MATKDRWLIVGLAAWFTLIQWWNHIDATETHRLLSGIDYSVTNHE